MGVPVPSVGWVVGEELGGTGVIEAAWTDRRVGVVLEADNIRDRRLASRGWTVDTFERWTAERLFLALIDGVQTSRNLGLPS
jgi:hypothetical protein